MVIEPTPSHISNFQGFVSGSEGNKQNSGVQSLDQKRILNLSLKAFSLAGSSSPGLPKKYSVLCGLFTLFGIIEKMFDVRSVRCSECLILGLFIVETIDSIVLNHSVFGLKRSASSQRSFVRATRESRSLLMRLLQNFQLPNLVIPYDTV